MFDTSTCTALLATGDTLHNTRFRGLQIFKNQTFRTLRTVQILNNGNLIYFVETGIPPRNQAIPDLNVRSDFGTIAYRIQRQCCGIHVSMLIQLGFSVPRVFVKPYAEMLGGIAHASAKNMQKYIKFNGCMVSSFIEESNNKPFVMRLIGNEPIAQNLKYDLVKGLFKLEVYVSKKRELKSFEIALPKRATDFTMTSSIPTSYRFGNYSDIRDHFTHFSKFCCQKVAVTLPTTNCISIEFNIRRKELITYEERVVPRICWITDITQNSCKDLKIEESSSFLDRGSQNPVTSQAIEDISFPFIDNTWDNAVERTANGIIFASKVAINSTATVMNVISTSKAAILSTIGVSSDPVTSSVETLYEDHVETRTEDKKPSGTLRDTFCGVFGYFKRKIF